MLKIIKKIEKVLIAGILLVFCTILVLSFIDIAYEITLDIIAPPIFIINADRLMELFSLFLIILIGLELLETIKVYLKEDVLHVEFVILVAIIAIARKVIIWDFAKFSYMELIGLSTMILALATGYYLLKRSGLTIDMKKKKQDQDES
ncbi:MAG: phosphate-starvation-inducible PsiE family protein [Proteobacteria bacterium]|nr:phosphate-starvation-inducible PsiE family protein [Pseudomonadota bacterium]